MRRFEEEEEDDLPVKKKRRRPKPKPVDDEDGEGPGKYKGKSEEDDEDGESRSTGNVLLDIVLDFFDDCVDWCRANQLKAVIIAVAAFLLFVLFAALSIRYVVGVMNRPTLTLAVAAYDHGSFPEAKMYAESVIKYARHDDVLTRAGALFVLGAATSSIADLARSAERQPYYLAAANYLQESAEYDFLPGRRTEGFFLFGRALYLSGELVRCREPLQRARETALEEKDTERTKIIEWFLANSYFLDADPDYVAALRSLRSFRRQPTVTEEEGYEADLFEAMIQLRLGRIDVADQAFARVPMFVRFETMRAFVSGQIAFFKARQLRQQAITLEASRDVLPTEGPVSTPSLLPSDEEPGDDLEHLLPEAEGPVRAVVPWDESASIIKRVAWMQNRAETEISETSDEPFNPDAIIVLPSEPEPSVLPQTLTDGPEPIRTLIPTDPRFQQAKELRLQATTKYQEAIDHFKDVAIDEQFQPRWRRQSLLLQGIAYEEMGDDVRARERFLVLIELSPGTSEAIAAEFLWANIEQRYGRTDTAQAGYARAFESLRKISNYANPWLPKSLIVERSLDAFRRRVLMKEYKEALTLLKQLADILPEPDRVRQAAGVYEQWADDLQRQANVSFLEQREILQKEAQDKYRLAGGAFGRLASLLFDTSEYSRLLWSSAENYRIGKDYRYGIIGYREYLKVNTQDRQAEALVYIGEMYIHLDGLDEAIAALERCLAEYPNNMMAPRARLALSRAYNEKKEVEQARKLLEWNLIGEYAPTAAVYRNSIYALGKLYFEHGDLTGCIPYFEDALQIHPDAPQAADAHYCLALAFLRRCDDALATLDDTTLEATRRKIETDSQIDRVRALEHLLKTEELLVKRQDAVGLSEAELLMLRNTLFGIGSIQMKLKQYDQAILTYDLAATRYQDRPEALDALLQIAVAYRMLDRPLDAVPILNRASILLDNLKKANIVQENNNWEEQIETQRNLALFEE